MSMLEINDIHKSFGDLEILKGINISVEKGDVIAILGPSGSGKTTLLRCINFLETADSGTMTFDGETFDLSHVSKKDIMHLRKKTAVVYRNVPLSSGVIKYPKNTPVAAAGAYAAGIPAITLSGT